jgi:hypothetical protein
MFITLNATIVNGIFISDETNNPEKWQEILAFQV